MWEIPWLPCQHWDRLPPLSGDGGSEVQALSSLVLRTPTRLGSGNRNGNPHWDTKSHGNPVLSSKHDHMGLRGDGDCT